MKNLTPFLILLVLGLIGWIDHYTGIGYHSVLFYIPPVVGAGWLLGRTWSVVVALLASLAWLVVEFLLLHDLRPAAIIFSGLTSLGTFLLIGLSISIIRREKRMLDAANDRISVLLEIEQRLARTDALTGLANSRYFREQLAIELARAQRDGAVFCLLYLDLDNLKQVNDIHGHEAGDRLIRQTAEVLHAHFRASDLPARLGGDEFAVLLWRPERAAIEQVGRRLIAALSQVAREYPDCHTGGSVGIAWFPTPPANPGEALREADNAMYHAKRQGKGQLKVIEMPCQPNPGE